MSTTLNRSGIAFYLDRDGVVVEGADNPRAVYSLVAPDGKLDNHLVAQHQLADRLKASAGGDGKAKEAPDASTVANADPSAGGAARTEAEEKDVDDPADVHKDPAGGKVRKPRGQ